MSTEKITVREASERFGVDYRRLLKYLAYSTNLCADSTYIRIRNLDVVLYEGGPRAVDEMAPFGKLPRRRRYEVEFLGDICTRILAEDAQ